MTERGCTPRKDQRPTRWPPSADSSRNDGPEPRSFRYAETGVSVSAMKVWRSGTSECSAASARASSRLGRMSIASAATGIQHLVGVGQREVARSEQHRQVVEDVGGLLGNALVGFLARCTRHLLGLLLHFFAYEWRVGKKLRRPRAFARLSSPIGDDALQSGQRLVRRGIGVAVVEAGSLTRVARRAG